MRLLNNSTSFYLLLYTLFYMSFQTIPIIIINKNNTSQYLGQEKKTLKINVQEIIQLSVSSFF